MLRRILQSLAQTSYRKRSPILRQRTLVAPLRPSLFICLGVSVTTIATIVTIHGDATQPSTDKSEKAAQKAPFDSLFPQPTSPSPTTDETFDLFSSAGILEERVTNISRIDNIILPRYMNQPTLSYLPRSHFSYYNSNNPCEDAIHHISVKFSDTLSYSVFGIYDGHNGNNMSSFLADTLTYTVLAELAHLYSQHVAASKPEHVDIEDRFSFVVKDAPDGDQQIEVRETEPGVVKGLYAGVPDPSPSDEEIEHSIKKAFLSLDSLIVRDMTENILNERISKEEGVRLLSVANAGSCALLGIYNNVERTLKVAVTGDSRAVLGRRVSVKEDSYAYETHALSADQNAHNPDEVERLRAAHPGEKVVENGRVLGWAMSRAFGDATYKWSREVQQRLHEEYLGDSPRSNCLTPPYFTAEPEITTTTIKKGDFVVLASDGLWDCLTNEEVVGLVGGWLETRGEEVKIKEGEGIGEGEMVMIPFGRVARAGHDPRTGFGKGKGYGWPRGSNGGASEENGTTVWERTDLPVTSLKPDDTPMYKWWRATKRFVNIDSNVAVHLTRNALGGADRDLTGALLRLSPPRSRRYR